MSENVTRVPADTEEIPAIEEYNGRPTLVLNPEAKFKFSFGLGKAKTILRHIEAIQRFVDSNGTSC